MSSTRIRYNTIDEYIAVFPQNIQVILEEMRNAIRESAPNAEETIAYRIPTFRLNGNLVHFAAYKNHIGFYPGGHSAIEAFKSDLLQYKTAKGTIQFPLDSPVPLDLVRRIVQFRVKENETRKKK